MQLNCAAVAEVTAALLQMLKQSVPSVLINVSSQAVPQPMPYLAVCAAAKTFLQSLAARCMQTWPRRECWCRPARRRAINVTDFDCQPGRPGR